jgi:hypothetical protein
VRTTTLVRIPRWCSERRLAATPAASGLEGFADAIRNPIPLHIFRTIVVLARFSGNFTFDQFGRTRLRQSQLQILDRAMTRGSPDRLGRKPTPPSIFSSTIYQISKIRRISAILVKVRRSALLTLTARACGNDYRERDAMQYPCRWGLDTRNGVVAPRRGR